MDPKQETMVRRLSVRSLVTAFALSLLAAPALAGGVNCKLVPCVHGGGRINESSAVPADFIVHISGRNGREQFFPGYPKFVPGVYNPKTKKYEAHVNAPNDPDAYDAWNETRVRAPKKHSFAPTGAAADEITATSVLYLESTLVDENGFITLTPTFATLYASVGKAVIAIPDLFMSDADGNVVDGGLLYGLVDFSFYLDHPPTFHLGDVFNVQNGLVAGLDGMRFSTTPFVFDDVGGTGFSDPPYSGYAVALSEHELQRVPEPAAWAMMLLGFAATGAALRQARQIRRAAA